LSIGASVPLQTMYLNALYRFHRFDFRKWLTPQCGVAQITAGFAVARDVSQRSGDAVS
jgi:hypothetical protein